MRPPVPIVFTSRTDPASFLAAAPEGEGFHYPGQRLWAAREGRLRLLTPAGQVIELTWQKPLPDGDTLIDVMSPSVTLDGRRILFSGRRQKDGHGRFRLYQVGLDGRGLQPLTGGPTDTGCEAVPPLRWDAAGQVMSDTARKQLDYDDVDPVQLNDAEGRILFVSSRSPDLGRDHARRSTTLWLLGPDGLKQPAGGNRNNDRWPYLLKSGYTSFTSWSRNREVLWADRKDVAPFRTEESSLTRPTDLWQTLFTQIPGGHFGLLAKLDLPTWRTRPLFANRLVFMTTRRKAILDGTDPLTVAQVIPGSITHSPSSQAGSPIATETVAICLGPTSDAKGRPLWLATPSACPPNLVVLSGASVDAGADRPEPGRFGLYLCSDAWPSNGEPASISAIDWRLLFDDPEMVDAEPVAVYNRGIDYRRPSTENRMVLTGPASLPLADGSEYRGPLGQLFATALAGPTMMAGLPGQKSNLGEGPIYDSPATGAIDHLRIYAARRDRFDDPQSPRIAGRWEFILKLPVQNGSAGGWVPTDAPTVLAGFNRDGEMVQWSTAAKDRQGRSAHFYAFAGDHYSLAQPNGKHFCVGCHAGHSGLPPEVHQHAERQR
ncbi:MAG: hypothetical protein EBV06_14820 [Planctomycetia bacterium]|nr:hypothetical protein [Planctomycetia bacterium]